MTKPLIETLRGIATRLPGVTEDVACKGTPIESMTFKTDAGKAFLFVQRKDDLHIVRIKLTDSISDAERAPGVEVGAKGWTKLQLREHAPLPITRITAWIGESYRVIGEAPKKKEKAPAVKKKVARKKPAAKK